MAPHLQHDPLDVEVERVVRVLRNGPARLDEDAMRARLIVFFDAVASQDAATLGAVVRRLPLSAAASVFAAVVHERPRSAAPGGDDTVSEDRTPVPASAATSHRGAIALSDDEWAARAVALRRTLTEP